LVRLEIKNYHDPPRLPSITMLDILGITRVWGRGDNRGWIFRGRSRPCNLASVSAIAAAALTNHPQLAHQPLIGASLYLLVLREGTPSNGTFSFPPTMTKIMHRRKTNPKSILSDPITVRSCLRRLQLSVRNLKIAYSRKTTDKDQPPLEIIGSYTGEGGPPDSVTQHIHLST
jgi:hypothetical protein